MMTFITPWIQIAVGGLGVAFALGGIARVRREGPRFKYDAFSSWLLLFFGLAMGVIGATRWP